MRNGGGTWGPHALQVLREAQRTGDPYQIVLVDQAMPDMDGEPLGRAIKADPLLKDTVLIMLTSLGQEEDAQRLRQLGFAGYLVKPVRASQLLETLVTAWGEHLQQQGTTAASPPLLEAPSALSETTPSSPAAASASTPRIRVLVVDDNVVNQKAVRLMLERLGCRVDVAANGKEAVGQAVLLPYDLILMDCEMPEMAGY